MTDQTNPPPGKDWLPHRKGSEGAGGEQAVPGSAPPDVAERGAAPAAGGVREDDRQRAAAEWLPGNLRRAPAEGGSKAARDLSRVQPVGPAGAAEPQRADSPTAVPASSLLGHQQAMAELEERAKQAQGRLETLAGSFADRVEAARREIGTASSEAGGQLEQAAQQAISGLLESAGGARTELERLASEAGAQISASAERAAQAAARAEAVPEQPAGSQPGAHQAGDAPSAAEGAAHAERRVREAHQLAQAAYEYAAKVEARSREALERERRLREDLAQVSEHTATNAELLARHQEAILQLRADRTEVELRALGERAQRVAGAREQPARGPEPEHVGQEQSPAEAAGTPEERPPEGDSPAEAALAHPPTTIANEAPSQEPNETAAAPQHGGERHAAPTGPEEELLAINSASFDQLRELGFSVNQATRVIAQRDQRGGFRTLQDLDQLQGLPRELIDQLKQQSRT